MTLAGFVSLLRGPGRDRARARAHVRAEADRHVRELVGDWDEFAAHVGDTRGQGLVVGTARTSTGRDVSVHLAFDDLYRHGLISGASGSGKTSMATWILASCLRTAMPIGVVDFKSDLFEAALRWYAAIVAQAPEAERPALARRAAVVNPFGESLVPLNVCRLLPGATPETQAYEVALALAKLFDAQMGFQMQNVLVHLWLFLAETELTLAEAPLVLQDEAVRNALLTRVQHPGVREFFGRTYPGVPSSSKDALITRLGALVLSENLRLQLGADECIDFRAIFDRGDPLVMFLGKGGHVAQELVEVVGSLFLQLIFQAAFARGGARRPYLVLCDEFFHLAADSPALTRRFETALTTLRSFGVLLGLVMHNFAQVHGSLREAILGNCDLMAIFRTSSRNAQFFGEFLPDTDPEVVAQALRRTGKAPSRFESRGVLLEQLQRLPDRTCWWYDRRKPYKAIRLRVPDVPAPHTAAGITERELERLIVEYGIRRGGLAQPKEVLREQIAKRRQRLEALVRPRIEIVSPVEPLTQPLAAGRPRVARVG